LIDVSDPTEPRPLEQTLTTVTGVGATAFSADGQLLAAASDDGTVTVWDVTDPENARQLSPLYYGHAGSIKSVTFLAGSSVLATGGNDETAIVWVVDRSGAKLGAGPFATSTAPMSLDFALADRAVTIEGGDGTHSLWNVTDRAYPKEIWTAKNRYITLNYSKLTTVAQNDRMLVTADEAGRVSLWNISDSLARGAVREITTFPSGFASVSSLATGLNDRLLAVGSTEDDVVALWDIADPTTPRQINTITTGTYGLAEFAPTGSILAVDSTDGAIALWDVSDTSLPRHVVNLPVRRDTSMLPIWNVRFSHRGDILALGEADVEATLWNVADPAAARPLGRLGASRGPVAVAPNGRIVATASATDPFAVLLWDITDRNTPRLISGPLTHNSSIDALTFSTDGRTLAVGTFDGVFLWDTSAAATSLDNLLSRACQTTSGGLDETEWARFVNGLSYTDSCAE
jgi:WD40 repeat protein